MKKLLLGFLTTALFSGSVYAERATLAKSTPEDGGTAGMPPSAFVLEFTEAVALHEVYIKKDNDKVKPVRIPQHNDAKTITIPAPPLAAGHYVLEWSAFTHDSKVLNGRIRFTVSGES